MSKILEIINIKENVVLNGTSKKKFIFLRKLNIVHFVFYRYVKLKKIEAK